MFKKVLVAEDLDGMSLAVNEILLSLGITDIHHAKYCDDAYLKIKKAILDKQPFDLLISDLSFKADHRELKLISGEDLIEKVKKTQPNIKIIVYSVEDKNFRIKSLFEKLKINGFILKGRKSLNELKLSLSTIFNDDKKFISPEMAHVLLNKSAFEISDFDVHIIKQLSLGIAQDRMDIRFKELGIKPNSKSTIEKRIGALKDHLKASNAVHLVAIAKDLGIV